MCEFDKPSLIKNKTTLRQQKLLTNLNSIKDLEVMSINRSLDFCENGEFTKPSLKCEVCFEGRSGDGQCHNGNVTVPFFECNTAKGTYISYGHVCDRQEHCVGGVDESFCVYPDCPINHFSCHNGQCVHIDKLCDTKQACVDYSDEICSAQFYIELFVRPRHRQGEVLKVFLHFHQRKVPWKMKSTKSECPASHFLCEEDLCLPVALRCNDITDCPGGDDELDCQHYVCPGYYRLVVFFLSIVHSSTLFCRYLCIYMIKQIIVVDTNER